MKYRAFGKTGWKVSEIGFGGWAIGAQHWGPQNDEESLAALWRAMELGVTFIDTAQGYGDGHSEMLIARALKERGQRIGRGPVRVLTKIPPMPGDWPPSPHDLCAVRFPEKYLRERVERSLNDLQAEALDVALLHTWSRAWNREPVALQTMRALQKEGKVHAIGVSTVEYDQDGVDEPMKTGMLDVVEVVYNIFEQDPASELLPVAGERGVAVVVRVPFDESALTGKLSVATVFPEGDIRRTYFRGDQLQKAVDRIRTLKERIQQVSGGMEEDLASVALRFILCHPSVSTTIPGVRTLRQAELNAAASDMPPLSDKLYEELKKQYWRHFFWFD